ncbi:MAG: glycosyltransferase family 39 protein [Planctomycetota bacterium]|nr:glycosyltransferase family 39 protein [Planctomycetaceae bacterium]MDQ3329630.1 glycosyltransferase family 39 protein [Planctomycetota bacterium]
MNLSALNRRISKPWSPVVVGGVVLLMAFSAFLLRASLQVGLDAVPGPGDEAEYDLLAMEIAVGHGFRFDYDNARWRAPYEQANGDGAYQVVLGRHGAAATTYRPPLFPTVMAGLYSVFGRSFAAVRIFNCLAMAAAGAIAAALVTGRLGALPGLMCGALFAIVEHRARYHAGLVLTESLAALFAVAIAAGLMRLAESGRLRAAIFTGVLVGLATLNRPLIVFWMPIVVGVAIWITPRRRFAIAALLTLSAVAVVAPWAIRNSLLLGKFSPLGTHGEQNLAAAYSDDAFRNHGIWANLDEAGFFPPEIDDSRPGIERELARAEQSRQAALRWIRGNVAKLPVLAVMRIWQLWQPRMHWDALVLGLAAFGFLIWPVQSERRIFGGLLLANTLAVAVTWSVGGRFLVPMLPVLHAAAACGCWAIALAVTERRAHVREWLRPHTS